MYCTLLCLYLALEVLKKHYNTLWRCFPDDYMLTLTTMCEVCTVGDGIPELITLLQTPEDCNQTILNYIISITKGDDQMMAFCNLMEKFINNTRFSKIISAFKKGTYVHANIDVYMYIKLIIRVQAYTVMCICAYIMYMYISREL